MKASEILNGPFVAWALKFGLSKSGILVTAGVAWLITAVGLPALIGASATEEIKTGLEAGALALVAAFYAWISSRMKFGVQVMQAQINESEVPTKRLELDGIPGNKTVAANAKLTNIPVEQAVELVVDSNDA